MGFPSRFGSMVFTSAIFLISLMVWGCGDDDDIVAPTTGSIDITCGPNEVTPTWSLEMPGGLHATGAGDFTLDASSPCASENSPTCGLIGALDVGCN